MGILLEEVCCVDSSNLMESEKYQSSYYREGVGRETDRSNIFNNEKFYDSSLIKSLPKNEIQFVTPKSNSIKEVKSLKTLPINTQNIIRKQSGNPMDYYDIIKKIGKGTFGTVFKVIHKTTEAIRAMKVIPKNNMKYGFTDDDIIQEINILKTLEHPHIIKLYEIYTYEDNYYLIDEFCTEGDLSDKLSKLKTFPEFVVKILMIQIFNAVKYLNEKNVIHGDLKLENIMIDSYLNNGDLLPVNNRNSFITSLLEDEKEINEYLRNNELKRASTFYASTKNKFHLNHNLNKDKKENEKENQTKSDNDSDSDDEIDSVEKLLKLRIKRGKSEYKPTKLLLNKKKQPIKKEISKSINVISTTNEKDCFKYLNGEDDTDDNKEDKDDNNINNNNISNGSDKISHNEPNGKEIISEDNNNNINHENNNMNEINNNAHRLIKIPNRFLKRDNMKKHLPTINEYGETKIAKEQYDTVEYNMSNLKKTSTIKLNSMKIKNYELKLIDFGCAKIFSKYKKNFEDTIGTLIYCSPEVLKNNYNKKCDIWSCGVIMYVLLSGHFPFFGKTEEEITKKILSGKFKFDERYFSNISDKAKDLISKCLIYDKNKRISIEEVLKHEFFADVKPNNIFQDEIDSKNVLNSLKNYSQQSKIYQTVLAYLSHNFADKEQLSRLKKIFYKIDLNLDGKLSKDELETAFKEAGMEMQKEQLNKVIESIDFDGNGYIEYEEFIRVTLPKEKLFTEANLKTAFDMFDLDKNGTISLNEFKEILGLGKIKDKNVNNELLKEIPIKGNEEITFEQFKKIIIG